MVDTAQLIKGANSLLRTNDHDAVASRRWARTYMSRHKPLFKSVRTKARSVERKAAQLKADVEGMLQSFQHTMISQGILVRNLYNADESGYRVGILTSGDFAWTYEEIPTVYSSNPEVRTLVTVIETISGTGQTVPPFIILPGKQLAVKHLNNCLEPATVLATSPSGYIDDQLALDWVDHWEKHTRPADPSERRMLVMDNHGSHCTIEFHQRCLKANVELFLLAPHATHILQPLDVGIFSICKAAHQKHILRHINYGEDDYSKLDFLDGLKYIRGLALKPSNCRSAWAKCGMVPYNTHLVLSALPDPVTSAVTDNVFNTKPGYIGDRDEQWVDWQCPEATETRISGRRIYQYNRDRGWLSGQDGDPTIREPTPDFFKTPPPPPSLYTDWALATTPKLNLGQIRHFDEYINDRITASISTGRPPSPTLEHVMRKRDKARNALALIAVREAQALKHAKVKHMERLARKDSNKLVVRYGPVVVGDARLRAATDEFMRVATRQSEAERIHTKDLAIERAALSRWLSGTRIRLETEIKVKRATLRVRGIKRAAQTLALQPLIDQANNEEGLLDLYRAERVSRHTAFEDEMLKAKAQRGEEIGRSIDEIHLPYNWLPPIDPPKPVTPWNYPQALVEEAIQLWQGVKVDPAPAADPATLPPQSAQPACDDDGDDGDDEVFANDDEVPVEDVIVIEDEIVVGDEYDFLSDFEGSVNPDEDS